MYLQLYTKTGLHMKEKAFLEIMAALPSRKYPVSFLYTYLGIFMEENKQDFLHRLCNRGWLESKDESVFMHPVIAESISRKVLHSLCDRNSTRLNSKHKKTRRSHA